MCIISNEIFVKRKCNLRDTAYELQMCCSGNNYLFTTIIVNSARSNVMVATGQEKVREFCAGSEKFEILRKVREIQENPFKVREI